MWKECMAILLSTNKKIHDTYMIDNLEFHTDKKISYNGIEMILYITSLDEEVNKYIKEGDWAIYVMNDGYTSLLQIDKTIKSHPERWLGFKKVIATTDSSLKEFVTKPYIHYPSGKYHDDEPTEMISTSWSSLPQILQQFIEEWIEEYNRGNVIENVEVEYEQVVAHEIDGLQFMDYDKKSLKLSEGNYISLRRKEQRSYTREETESLIVDGMGFMNSYIINHDILHGQEAKQVAKNWIKENLK